MNRYGILGPGIHVSVLVQPLIDMVAIYPAWLDRKKYWSPQESYFFRYPFPGLKFNIKSMEGYA